LGLSAGDKDAIGMERGEEQTLTPETPGIENSHGEDKSP